MRTTIKQSLLAPALLLLATMLGTASCTQDENEPGGMLPKGKITLVPTVTPTVAWNTTDDTNAPGTRADASLPVTLAAGGKVWIGLIPVKEDGNPGGFLGCNYFTVTADGKLARLPFANRPNEIEAPLGIDVPGQYSAPSEGDVNLTMDGIACHAYVRHEVELVTIGTDGKLTVTFPIVSAGLRLNVKNTDGSAYTGADISATLMTLAQFENSRFEAKTPTAAAPGVIWGDIYPDNVRKDAPLLELTAGGKTYRVNTPRQITFTGGRLYTFNVWVGATGITVSSDDLGIDDFEVQHATDAEAEPVPLYNGQPANLLAIPGQTAYWVAPEDASTGTQWVNIDFSTICPAGWHVPTKDEFVAMTGIPADSNSHSDNYDAINAVFPTDYGYWSSTEEHTPAVWMLRVLFDTSLIASVDKTSSYPYSVRCVRAK